jgi:hypothetical protein
MRQIFAFLAAVVVLFQATASAIAAPGAPGVGAQLSLCITNKYGDVLTNPTVAQILGDGLVLERGTMALKIKYQDLPPVIRKQYQALVPGVIQKEEKQEAANTAYFSHNQKMQAEQARHLAAQERQINEEARTQTQAQSSNTPKYLSIPIPHANWKLTIRNLGFRNWTKQEDNNQFVLRSQPGPGFSLVLIVAVPANNLAGNDPVYDFYWSNMAHNSLIDPQSVKNERTDRFIRVSYTAQGQPNVNYFFAYQDKWVDVHLSKGSPDPGDAKLLAGFDSGLFYSQ